MADPGFDAASIVDPAACTSYLESVASSYLSTALACIEREFPHIPAIFADRPGAYPLHKESHPIFFGALDWHSSVEMYWVAVRLLRLFPEVEGHAAARETLDRLLTAEPAAREAEYLTDSPSFERPYGRGWLLTLLEELARWEDEQGRRWYDTLLPLADPILDGLAEWLPKLDFPHRVGMHPNIAFGLSRSWTATTSLRPGLLDTYRERAAAWFLEDTDYPFRYEPSAADFLSPGLCEAELMSRVLGTDFPAWYRKFAARGVRFDPVSVSDPSEGQIAHLAGLNLSRAWALTRIAASLDDAAQAAQLALLAADHANAGLPAVVGGDYMVEHWLAAYAMLLLTNPLP